MVGFKFIAGVIVSLMFLLTAWSFQSTLIEEGGSAGDIEICRQSVLLRSQATISDISGSTEKLTPLNCKTQDKEGTAKTAEKEAEQVTKLMSKCWYMFAEGRTQDIFKVEKGAGCHVCYQYLPSKDVETTSEDVVEYMRNTPANPGALSGVMSSDYIGDGVEMRVNIGRPQSTLELANVEAPNLLDYVDDPGQYISDQAESTINEKISNLANNGVNGYVIVADDIPDQSRGAVQEMMRRIQLSPNESEKKGFVLSVSLTDKEARLDLGADLRTKIPEKSIAQILQPLKSVRNTGQVGGAVQAVVGRIEKRFNTDEDTTFKRGSYLAYLSNGGETYPIIPEELNPNAPYAIAYVAPSDQVEDGAFTETKEVVLPVDVQEQADVTAEDFILMEKFSDLPGSCKVQA